MIENNILIKLQLHSYQLTYKKIQKHLAPMGTAHKICLLSYNVTDAFLLLIPVY